MAHERILAFGPFRLLLGQRVLLQDGQPVAVGGRALDILSVLAQRAGEIVGKDDLMARVWPEGGAEEATLRVHVATLRKALGDGRDDVKCVIGRGYSFVAAVETVEMPAHDAPVAAAPEANLGRLPTRPVRMIGRDETVALLCGRLRQDRLITIVGPGGVGKTTVGLAVAGAAADPSGTRFLDLASMADPSQVLPSLAGVLGVSADGDLAVMDVLRGRPTLLVLDNCDRVVGGVAALAEAILTGTTATRLIVTSREPLGIGGERVHRLEPLGYPAAADGMTLSDAMSFAAIKLFVERASASWDEFCPADDDVPLLATICRRLDGLPLALELAAGRVDSLGLRTMAESLDGRYCLIMRGRRTAVPRHQTLRSMLDSSYNDLPAHEQAMLRRLGVFNAPATLGSVIAMADGLELSPDSITGIVQNLVDKSLLCSNAACYGLLATTRIYAREKLLEAGEDADIRRLHARLVLTQLRQIDLLADEGLRAELRAALDWATGPGGHASLAARLAAAAARVRTGHAVVEQSGNPARDTSDALAIAAP